MTNLNFDDIVAEIVSDADRSDLPDNVRTMVDKFCNVAKDLCDMEYELTQALSALPEEEIGISFGGQQYGIDNIWRIGVYVDEVQVGWLMKAASFKKVDRWMVGNSLEEVFQLKDYQPLPLDELQESIIDSYESQQQEATNKYLSEE